MKLIHGLLDYTDWQLPDVYLFTGNPVRNRFGEVVMGRGAALAVKRAYPGIGKHITTDRPVTWYEISPGKWIGWFQVKHHWRQDASLDLIRRSARYLGAIAEKRPEQRFHLNCPGTGNGRLDWADVEPVLQCMPDNVLVYK